MSVGAAGAARLAAVLFAASAALAAASGCQVARPAFPRTATAGSTTVGLDHARDDSVAVTVRGAPVRAAWLVDGPPAGAACGSGVGAVAVGPETHRVAATDGGPLVELHFPRGALFEHFTRPSSLALQLQDDAASCAVLPLSGADPALAYRIGSGAIWNFGSMMTVFLPLAGRPETGYGVLEWDPFRFGRWLGPVRPTGAVGFALSSRTTALHGAASLVGYPLVFRRVAIGVGAGYEVRPSWGAPTFPGGDRFKWVHGPRAELLFMFVHDPLLGWPPPVKMRKLGFTVWASRLDADGFSATLLGLGVARE
ncbi:MAG TPA: hypothetical protein VHL80_17895 [Polyangia bacterium]|nr:hypothetical protein [Polyangia bacterium]